MYVFHLPDWHYYSTHLLWGHQVMLQSTRLSVCLLHATSSTSATDAVSTSQEKNISKLTHFVWSGVCESVNYIQH